MQVGWKHISKKNHQRNKPIQAIGYVCKYTISNKMYTSETKEMYFKALEYYTYSDCCF